MIKANVILHSIAWKKYLKNPNSFIDKKVKLLNKKSKLYKKNIFIFSILLSRSKEIKKLNKKFRKMNKPTDVLSFPFYKKEHLKKVIKRNKEVYIGDIIINLDKIKDKKKKIKFQEEFNKLWIHGLTHLFGHKHKKDRDFFIMQSIEKKYLKYIN